LGGFKIGEVSNLNGIVDRSIFGDARVRLKATLAIQPARLGLQGATTPEAALAFLSEQVRTVSLRARLASASILTGGLKVQLVEADDGFAATMSAEDGVFPEIPVTKSEITDVSATAEGVFNRINKLPVEELMSSAIELFETATAFVSDEKLRETPSEVFALIEDMRGLVGSETAQNVPVLLNSALGRIEGLMAQLDEAQSVARLTTAIESVGLAAKTLSEGSTELPALLEEATQLVAKANELPLETLVTRANNLVATLNGVLGSESVMKVPTALTGALDEVQGVLADLRAEKGIERMLGAVDAVMQAAETANTSIEGVPELIAGLNALADKANDIPVNEVAESLSTLLTSANAVLDTQDARELPANLSDALGELQSTLTELREGGAVANINKTLESARIAADQVAVSVQDLPGLIDRMTRLLSQASATLQSYDGRSELNRGARDALRDIAEAAEAVSSLARTLERNPNSLLLGR
jgi:paraquat-inducible protein B